MALLGQVGVSALNDSVSGTTHTLTIDSPPNPFIQVRATLSSSDQVFSPNITDITVRYYQDVDAPTNPSSVTAYTDVPHITTIAPEHGAARVAQALFGEWPKRWGLLIPPAGRVFRGTMCILEQIAVPMRLVWGISK